MQDNSGMVTHIKEMDKIMETLGNMRIKLFALDALKEY
jgi:hypothetical protein